MGLLESQLPAVLVHKGAGGRGGPRMVRFQNRNPVGCCGMGTTISLAFLENVYVHHVAKG